MKGIGYAGFLATAAIVLWAGFFLWLLASGEAARFVCVKTAWVVPFGAAALAVLALLHLLSSRPAPPSSGAGLARGGLAGLVVLVAPILALAAVPDASLGSLAAQRKADSSSFSSFPDPYPNGSLPADGGLADGGLAGDAPGFLDLAAATRSVEYAGSVGIFEGDEVSLEGFLLGDQASLEEASGGGGEAAEPRTLQVARLVVACCAADARPLTIEVDAAAAAAAAGPAASGFGADAWLAVQGSLERRGERLVVVASSIEEIPEPDDPYLRAGATRS